MTDDFINCATNTTDTMKSLLQKAELLKAYTEAFERGETATLTLNFGNATIFKRDFKSDARGEMIRAFLRGESENLLAQFAECVTDLQTLIESEEMPQ